MQPRRLAQLRLPEVGEPARGTTTPSATWPASPRVAHTHATVTAPAAAACSSSDPQPNVSSSGWATTTCSAQRRLAVDARREGEHHALLVSGGGTSRQPAPGSCRVWTRMRGPSTRSSTTCGCAPSSGSGTAVSDTCSANARRQVHTWSDVEQRHPEPAAPAAGRPDEA